MITYEEMIDARSDFEGARMTFYQKYHDFLKGCIEKAGFTNKLVQLKDSTIRGQFKIAQNISTRQPWEIKFYPLTKNGEVSMRSKYLPRFYSWQENTLTEQLISLAEVVVEP